MKRLFLDMDGTLARFHDEPLYLERMWEKGFFQELKPFREAVDGVRHFIKNNPDIKVFTLSASIGGEYCLAEKNAWLDKYLPDIDKEYRIFSDMGKPKVDYIPKGIYENDCLYDDYNHNLEEWQNAGGIAIKCKNNINHKGLVGELWQGKIVDNLQPPSVISYSLKKEIYSKSPYIKLQSANVGLKYR